MEREQRDWVLRPTVLAGMPSTHPDLKRALYPIGTLVTITGMGYRTGAVDGLVLREAAVGIWCKGSSPLIVHNTITGLSSVGIFGNDGTPIIADNIISANAGKYGAGISWKSGAPRILNNTIAGNVSSTPADGLFRESGGLYLYRTQAQVSNNIIAFNSSGVYNEGLAGQQGPTFRNNCFYGNTVYDVRGSPNPIGTDGNIRADPLFADFRHANLHIQPDSPCRDAGDNAVVVPGDRDIDGQPRVLGAAVDIGADETDGTAWNPESFRVVLVRPDGDDAAPGSSWVTAKRTFQGAFDALTGLGGEVWVAAGTYHESVHLPPFVSLYGGFSGAEARRSERDPAQNVTVIDGGSSLFVVSVTRGNAPVTVDGFSLRNRIIRGITRGLDNHPVAGAVYCINTAPVIAHNVIASNDASVYSVGATPDIRFNDLQAVVYCSNGPATIANNDMRSGIIGLTGADLTIENNIITAGADYPSPFYSKTGAIEIFQSKASIRNNTIAGNLIGLYVDYQSDVTAGNNIIAFNETGVIVANNSTAALHHNNLFGNATATVGIEDPNG